MVTDGIINDAHSVFQLIKDHCQDTDIWKLFSFGVGDKCSKYLIKNSAKIDGRGDYAFVPDADLDSLKHEVIDKLQKASEPTMQKCSFSFIKIPVKTHIQNLMGAKD